MSTNRSLSFFLALSLLLISSHSIKGSSSSSSSSRANTSSTSTADFFPLSPAEYRPMDAYMTGAAFQLCLDCRCCSAADPSDCSSMSCCYGIDCNLPDKPYGVCAFVPNSCNCTSCN